ncbi:MAG: tyrosine-type recombinase/integrase [Myxococcota bacterium]
MAAESQGWTRRPIGGASGGATSRSRADAAVPPAAIAADDALLDPASAYLAQLGPGSRRTMREALDKLARLASDGRCDLHELPWQLLRIEHTAALRTRLCSILAPATANKHMAALRGVLKQCWRQGRISAEEYRRITDLPPIRGEARRRTLALAPSDFERLAGVCAADTVPAGARDEALLALLRSGGLRRAEAVALDRTDYDAQEGVLTIREASGRGERRIETPDRIRSALTRWLAIRGDVPGPLFNPVNKGGRIERRRLSEQAIYIACQKRASEAGLPPTSPEDLRRPFSEA